ncbi:hypothetical protein AB0M20_07835 [Actinoplanes sp. NPDC051633]|uniref:hypothetical protein n=1 Tax=Actinoplanes sp. NPDC051633 TaxID=3155670 RepID=UPI003423F8CB
MGLFIILLMSIATVLLIRNMNKRLRRLPDSFDNVDGKSGEKSISDPTDDESVAGQPEDRQTSSQSGGDVQVNGGKPDDRPASTEGGATRS